MRHFRTSRVADRDHAVTDLLGADGGLEASPVPVLPDEAFSLRPLAATLPGDDVVVTDPLGEGSEIDHLLRRAREQVQRGRPAEGALTYRQLLELDPTHRGALLGLQKLYIEAEADLRRVLKKEHAHAGALVTLGVVQVRKGLPSEGA